MSTEKTDDGRPIGPDDWSNGRTVYRADGSAAQIVPQPTTPLDTLRAIAALVKTLPHSMPHVHFGCGRAAFDGFAAIPDVGRRTSLHVAPTSYVIEHAETKVDGVTFEAQCDRPPTADELARAHEAQQIGSPCVALRLA